MRDLWHCARYVDRKPHWLVGRACWHGVGASLGGLTGALFDLRDAGIDNDFVEEVSRALTPSKTV